MTNKYEPKKIEKKWQDYWLKKKVFKVKEDHTKPKYYCLEMFPYPSGRIHMGHVRNYAIGDVITRYKKMRGFNVLHPMGWDAFGMPAENAAIEKGVHPATWTRDNIAYMKGQLLKIGLGYDWDREVTTCDDDYYRWNQWIFLKMYKKGLAYKKISSVNWCPSCETVLANEQVEEGRCWRCDSPVTQKELEQWFFKITAYAEELLSYCDRLHGWPERVLLMQRNWIGKSVGAEVKFPIADSDEAITIFTTRLDTIYGATFMSIAPEHPIVEKLSREEGQGSRVKNFIEKVKGQNKIFRTAIDTEKEGVFTGSYAINPFTKEKIPIWLANFVLLEYGTGAVMAVPAHDQRDFEFAKKYNLPIRVVVQNPDRSLSEKSIETACIEDGYLVNSGQFDDLSSQEARERMADHIEREGLGRKAINYRLRDWGISRQRYWGTPIPIIYCDSCGTVPVSERDLPARLPEGVAFTGKGGSPLSDVKEFIETTCPKCKGKARRETDTMDTFVDSSWYFLRYLSPRKKSAPFDKKNAAYWMPVDQYIGGMEHAVLHLLYARFFTKVLRDLGLMSIDEPFNNLLTQGMVCKETLRCPEHGWLFPEEVKEGACLHCDKPVEIGRTEKMSKSKRNIVDPEALINTYGADTARLFSLFAAPPEKDLEWSEQGVEGSYRFLHRVWNLVAKYKDTIKKTKGATIDIASLSEEDRSLYRKTHLTIKKVTEDIERDFHFNTAIAALMELVNQVSQYDLSEEPENRKIQQVILKISLETVLLLLSPFAPHIAEELWCEIGNKPSIFQISWPLYCTEAISMDNILIVIQINGKVRSRVFVPAASSMEDIKVAALQDKKIQELLAGKSIRKVVVVPGRLVNIVV